MRRRVLSFLLCAILCVSLFPAAAAARDFSTEESLAAQLKQLGLFKGVSESSFELDRAPTRIEALVMLIRVLGREQEALNGDWTHPFTDVPAWADKYVGYAYRNGLANGIGGGKFGNGNASAAQYLTFVLRALGYSDANGLDFTWDRPFSLAGQAGILTDRVDTDDFLRADVVLVSYAALDAYLKGSHQTLAQKLIDAGVFSQDSFDRCYRRTAPADAGAQPAADDEPPQPGRQALAYAALKELVVTGHNDTVGEDPACCNYESTDADYYRYGVTYNAEHDALSLYCETGGGGQFYYALLTLEPDGRTYYSEFSYYAASFLESPTFSADQYIDASRFRSDSDFTLKNTSGDTQDLAAMSRMAQRMYRLTIRYTDYLFRYYVMPVGKYSMADFGISGV